jgi:hypothetical protein
MHPEFNSGKARIWIVRCNRRLFAFLSSELPPIQRPIFPLSPFQFKFQTFVTLPTSLVPHLDTISDPIGHSRIINGCKFGTYGEACVAGKGIRFKSWFCSRAMSTHRLRWQSGRKSTVASSGDKITPGCHNRNTHK